MCQSKKLRKILAQNNCKIQEAVKKKLFMLFSEYFEMVVKISHIIFFGLRALKNFRFFFYFINIYLPLFRSNFLLTLSDDCEIVFLNFLSESQSLTPPPHHKTYQGLRLCFGKRSKMIIFETLLKWVNWGEGISENWIMPKIKIKQLNNQARLV